VSTRRYLTGPAGYLGEATTTSGTTTLSIALAGLHGDILRTTTPTATGSPDGQAVDADEFGIIHDPDTGAIGTGPRYSWLGTKQRATDAGTSGLTLMGVRLYTPLLGRFLSTDPVYGGNSTTYSYPVDPINRVDVDGRMSTTSPGSGDPSAHPGLKFWFRQYNNGETWTLKLKLSARVAGQWADAIKESANPFATGVGFAALARIVGFAAAESIGATLGAVIGVYYGVFWLARKLHKSVTVRVWKSRAVVSSAVYINW
jgi:RHS repeat-associated protein